MNQYPKWLLALIFPGVIIPAGTMIFYLFGGVRPFGSSDHWFWDFMLYLLPQLLWVVPVISFFLSLFLWGWMREKAAIFTGIVGLIISIASVFILIA